MKLKIPFAFACLFAALAVPVHAQKAGDLGVGVIVGGPTALTGKLWFNGTQAADLGIGWYSRATIYGDYLWHGWSVLPQPAQGKLPVYLGVGAQVRTYSDAELGLRAVLGIAYWLPNNPVEIFAEVVPVFYLTRDTGVGGGGGIGLRYYFTK